MTATKPDVYNLKGRLPIASPFRDPEKMIAIRKQQMEEAKAKYDSTTPDHSAA
jgi:hypothetical protein